MERNLRDRRYFITSLVLCVILVFGSIALSKSYGKWNQLKKTMIAARRDQAWLESIKKEIVRAQRLVNRVNKFAEEAKVLGLTPEAWKIYDVDIQEKVSFPQLVEILQQTTTGLNYYFEPFNLYLTKSEPDKEGKAKAPDAALEEQQSPQHGGEVTEGDMYLRLKGNFIVRR
ncbi:MAG: hypothetical protein DRH12_17140 [Deltaproteobacteria bacterium]|nr:MAG: hypothetical protein DRH12_17140 [Deltaproteobacteria bacterium]